MLSHWKINELNEIIHYMLHQALACILLNSFGSSQLHYEFKVVEDNTSSFAKCPKHNQILILLHPFHLRLDPRKFNICFIQHNQYWQTKYFQKSFIIDNAAKPKRNKLHTANMEEESKVDPLLNSKICSLNNHKTVGKQHNCKFVMRSVKTLTVFIEHSSCSDCKRK